MAGAVFTLGQLAEELGGSLRGDAARVIDGLATLQEAGPSQLSFLANTQYRKYLASTRAGAVLLSSDDVQGYPGAAIIVSDPYLAYARASHLFETRPAFSSGVHPTAVVAPDAEVHPSASIGAYVVIEAGACIEADVEIGAQSFIGARSRVGEGGRLAPRVTLYHDVQIGKRVVIQSGAVIGGEDSVLPRKRCLAEDRPDRRRAHWRRRRDRLNTTIDRGALSDTLIGSGVSSTTRS